ncbi:NAD(P)-dependent oxidoreductase [Candidatus Roizmanbacteria bacterium]|nr:NAD(P)-dependent oxidoreductase [Candidatus Roizmanbacteria bacterium]
MKILITGGAGFLGLHLAKYLSKKNVNVTLADIAEIDEKEYPKSCQFFRADIRNVQSINRLVKDLDVVIHAAAALPLWEAKEIFEINVSGTRNLLQASLKNRVKRFIFISSTAVYGVPKKHPIFEDDPLVGVGAYGESKIQAEKLCESSRKKDLVITIIRPKTFVGTHRLGVFEILFDWIRDGKRIPVIGSGNNRYQLLDVDDLVEAIYRLIMLTDKKKVNKTFNIGAEKFRTVREDLEKVFDYAGRHPQSGRKVHPEGVTKKSRILPTPALVVKKALWFFEKLKLSPLYQWVYDTADKDSYVSINRLIDTLKWRPKYSNSQALIKAYQWYLDNYDEIKSKPAGVTHRVGWKQGILGFFKKLL